MDDQMYLFSIKLIGRLASFLSMHDRLVKKT